MGWTFTRDATKEDLIQEILADLHPIVHELCGDTLWAVVEDDIAGRLIACYLLELGGAAHGWGYKDLWECMHPYYYDCPLRFLELAPVACEEWRALVRGHHATRPDQVR